MKRVVRSGFSAINSVLKPCRASPGSQSSHFHTKCNSGDNDHRTWWELCADFSLDGDDLARFGHKRPPYEDLTHSKEGLCFWTVASVVLLRLDHRVMWLLGNACKHAKIQPFVFLRLAFGDSHSTYNYADMVRGFPLDMCDLDDENPQDKFVPLEGELLQTCLANCRAERKYPSLIFTPHPVAHPIPGAKEMVRKLILKAECSLFGNSESKEMVQREARQAAADYADVKFGDSKAESTAVWGGYMLEDVVWQRKDDSPEYFRDISQTAKKAACGREFFQMYRFELPHFNKLVEREQEWEKVKSQSAMALVTQDSSDSFWDERLEKFDGNAAAHLYEHYLDMKHFHGISTIRLRYDYKQILNRNGHSPRDHECFWYVVETVLFRLGNKVRWLIQQACKRANIGMEEFVYHLLGSRNRPYTDLDYSDFLRGFGGFEVDYEGVKSVEFPEINGELLESFRSVPQPLILPPTQIVERIHCKLDNLPPGAKEFVTSTVLCAEEELFKGCGNKGQLVFEARIAIRECVDMRWQVYQFAQYGFLPVAYGDELRLDEVEFTEDVKLRRMNNKDEHVLDRASKVADAGGSTKWGFLSLYKFELHSQLVDRDNII